MVVVHVLMVVVANHLAFALRFDGQVPQWAHLARSEMLPWLVVIRGLLFIPFGLYRGLWRYAGIWDLRNIVASVSASSIAFYVVTESAFGVPVYPRSVFIVDALLLTCSIGGLRLATRMWRDRSLLRLKPAVARKRVLIFGAGDAGEQIVRDIKNSTSYDYDPIGFADDDVTKVGQSIHGVPVLGTRDDLPKIIAERRPDEVLIALPAAEPATVRGVVRSLESFKVPITVLPNLRDILAGKVTVSQIRNLAVEDLLPRAPVGLDQTSLQHLIEGRRVLVTGAGGSIGSELCQQLAARRPEALILYERAENALYAITNTLADRGPSGFIHPLLGDITDVERLDGAMAEFRPEILFHAAAHKHVPLMEASPCEAVKNNVAGTQLVAEAARRHGVRRFILISTDKAVNPTSVMGATKRVAELIMMTQGHGSSTAFLTVRFGNVLGSNGSAIPRFMEQIKAGGPVTITHPDMRRYFMLLPEAAQLVLHVAGHGRNGGVYVLDMGEQIKIVDMARNLIRLSGFVPDEDIKITFVGLRPGEKLFEELVGANETVRASSIEKVSEVCSNGLPAPGWLAAQVHRLEALAAQEDAAGVVRGLQKIVPEFTAHGWEQALRQRPRVKAMRVVLPASLQSPAAG